MKHSIQSMSDNLYWRLRYRFLRATEKRCVTVSELFDWVWKYAPKTLKNNQPALCEVVKRIWRADSEYEIEQDEWALEDYNECIEIYFSDND